ncbi:MAG TPA: M48 family metallopeptidase [Brevefilum sp.]|nr:M48 family metallopeptidase [Brevefilum sp.]HOR19261.1 M48 family metallopeptidase [Brevefilum sp.]HPL69489.1 M48 family metallopeptidase [Brevefilum sp.]
MTQLDLERQKQAKQYGRIKRQLWLVDQGITLLYALLWLATGWSVALRSWLANMVNNDWFIVAGFAAVFSGIFFIISLPMGYYTGYILPHRFDLSTQSLKDWVIDQLKSLVVGAVLGLILIELVYLILRLAGDYWWLWLTGGVLFFSVLMTNLAPVLLMPIFNKFTPLDEEHADLAERLVALAEKAGTKVRGVFKMDMSRRTKQANASLTGLGNTRRIILGDTLISEFSADEIETVLAHELGHHVNHDVAWLIGGGTVLTALGLFLVSRAMVWAIAVFGFTGASDPAGFPALMILFSLYQLITMPIENAFSRWRENKADDYALQATNKAEAFSSAFKRLANQNLSDVDPESWVVFMFYSHPPLQARIAKAEGWQETAPG